MLVGLKEDDGRSVAVVETVVVVYSEGVYLEDSIRWSGIGSIDEIDAAGIVTASCGILVDGVILTKRLLNRT